MEPELIDEKTQVLAAAVAHVPSELFVPLVIVISVVAGLYVGAKLFDHRLPDGGRKIIVPLSLVWIAFWAWLSIDQGAFFAILNLGPIYLFRKLTQQ